MMCRKNIPWGDLISRMLKVLQNKSVEDLAELDFADVDINIDEWKKSDQIKTISETTNENVKLKLNRLLPDFKYAEQNVLCKICFYYISAWVIKDVKNSSGLKTVEYEYDSSLTAMIIFAMLYENDNINRLHISNFIYNKFEISIDGLDYHFRGDIMNSYATTFHRYLNCIGYNANKGGKYRYEIMLLEYLKKNKGIEISEEATRFLKDYHTIGNIILVPFVSRNQMFNNPRGIGKYKDYWDLTLLCIYNWYMENKTEYNLYNLLMENDKHVALCEKWLEKFKDSMGEKSWYVFVEKNYLQDFVEIDGKPKELWKGHFTGKILPEKKEQYHDFFTNASDWIEKRGKRIVEKIKNERDAELRNWILDKIY